VEADDLYHTAGQKGQAKQGGKKPLGACPRISVIGSLNPNLACQLCAQMGHDL
jgi:hypothetical protein